MKKIHVLALSAAVALGAFVTSCDGGSTPSASLKTQADTLSYAYGVQLAESGLSQYLDQLGVVKDTAAFKMSYQYRITNEADPAKKAELEKELTTQLDSLNKANAKNMSQFIKGLNESFNSSSKTQDAYFNGLQLGAQLKAMTDEFQTRVLDDVPANKSALLAGLLNSIQKEKLAVPDAQQIIQNKMMESQAKAQAKQEEELKKSHTATIEAGDKFMAENKTKEGVTTTASGLQYKVVKEGKGTVPTASDRVKVNYKGTLIDGTVFDTNDGQAPIEFGVGQVIKGWTEALQLMPAGSKWILYIPYDLAYGGQAAGSIPPFSNLVFEVELVDVAK